MNPKDTTSLIDDRISNRFESWVQTQQKLHDEYHLKIVQAVEQQIKVTVNGKIDRIDKKMDAQDVILKSLDERIRPFEAGVGWVARTKEGLIWLAGFVTPMIIVGGAVLYLLEQVRK